MPGGRQEVGRNSVTGENETFELVTFSRVLHMTDILSLPLHNWCPNVCVCVFVGIPNMARGGVGPHFGGDLPRTHAGAHPDEVHIHQSIRVGPLSAPITLLKCCT